MSTYMALNLNRDRLLGARAKKQPESRDNSNLIYECRQGHLLSPTFSCYSSVTI